MSFIGIDIGSNSVRLYNSNHNNLNNELTISINHSLENSNIITQSSWEIQQCIEKLLANNKINEIGYEVDSISITATCSMVVREVIEIDDIIYLKSFNVGDKSSVNQDIILWMDNRSINQTESLNNSLSPSFLNKLGGKLIPEMGIPKLKWLSDKFPDKKLIVFEMYDWFSLILKNGYTRQESEDEILVPYYSETHQQNDIVTYEHEFLDEAMDGSIKGWSNSMIYDTLQISKKIKIGKSELRKEKNYDCDCDSRLPPIGFPIGNLNNQFIPINKQSSIRTLIGHGCIDCYSGWLSMITDPGALTNKHSQQQYHDNNQSHPIQTHSTLSMIAGTSTCFILSLQNPNLTIPGIWGPFPQLLGSNFKNLFEFGQSATGKLFENLFKEYKFILSMNECGTEFFQFLESETENLELKHNCNIIKLCKSFFYYGDKFGNRSPYNSFEMSELIMDGGNNSSLPNLLSPSSTPNSTIIQCVLKYNLILEFLILQMKQIIENIENIESKNEFINTIIISGSQVKNKRLLNLMKMIFPNKQINIINDVDNNGKFSVARGASIISRIAFNSVLDNCEDDLVGSYEFNVIKSIEAANESIQVESVEDVDVDEDVIKILGNKYWMLKETSKLQSIYREKMKGL